MKMIFFYSYTNKTYFHNKGFALNLVLKEELMAVRETGSEMHQNALWDCFGDAVALLQGITRFRRKLSQK